MWKFTKILTIKQSYNPGQAIPLAKLCILSVLKITMIMWRMTKDNNQTKQPQDVKISKDKEKVRSPCVRLQFHI